MSGKVFACTTDGTCPKHGKYIYFCNDCHEQWRESHPKTAAAIAAMADPKVSYSRAKQMLSAARKEEE